MSTTTAMTDLHLPVAAQPSIDSFVEIARQGESQGYDRVWLPETWGRDAVTGLAAIATETETIGIGSSICNVYSRSPALLGQTATTLQELSSGRFRLGIGPSGPAVVEGWHGLEFDRPLRRTREAIEIIRSVTGGETVTYDGDIFSLSGFRLRCDPPETRVPIDAAGMGPKTVELAGRFADGWHATVLTPEGLTDRLEDFDRGVSLGDRDRAELQVTVSLTACALNSGERARQLAREHMAFYIGAMGTYYRESLTRQGYDEAAEIAAAWANGNRDRACSLIDDSLLDALCAAGPPSHASARLEAFASIDGVDTVAVGFPRGATPEEIHETIEALAPESR